MLLSDAPLCRLKYRLARVAALLGALGGATIVTSAQAYDWVIETTVSVVEPTYIPAQVTFQVNAAAGSCAQGTWLTWNAKGSDEAAQIANVQGVLATLLSAKLSGKTIRIVGSNSGCTIDYIYFIG